MRYGCSPTGAQVLVNISNDGWYGDTCAPWQTLNMSRMRAVENRRWLLRDTNTGLTTIIDPYGRLTASIQRHALTSLAAKYGYRSDLTFYTLHGDLFAYLCGIITLSDSRRDGSAGRAQPQGRTARIDRLNSCGMNSNLPTLRCAKKFATFGSIFDHARIDGNWLP